MFRWFVQFLYGSTPVRFSSPYSALESKARLSAVVKPSIFHSFLGQCAVGIVTEERVRVQRVIPFVGNSFKPFFYGSISASATGSVLEGVFKFSLFTRIFMTFWFGFIAIWTLLATAIVLTKSPSEFWFPLSGVGMFAAGLGGVGLGKWFARNDIAWLTQIIVQALDAKGTECDGQVVK